MEEKKQPRIKILVACHKADPNIRQDDIYMPIQVGKALHPELDLGFQCDNTGDNISEKNESYCELTALYWAWKNLKDVDYIGLCHYRRYFKMTNAELSEAMNSCDILLAKPLTLSTSVYNELVYWTCLEDATVFIDSILSLFPEYKEDVISYYFMENKFSQCNMMLMSKEKFYEYCNFIFPIIQLTESRIKISGYTRQRRVFGYLAETALGLWLKHNKLKNRKINIITGVPTNRAKELFNDFRFEMAFMLSKRLTSPVSVPIIPPLKTGLTIDGIECNASE
ncbi:MAG: DUF4422 domain-containing protein [Muribaculum sp.]